MLTYTNTSPGTVVFTVYGLAPGTDGVELNTQTVYAGSPANVSDSILKPGGVAYGEYKVSVTKLTACDFQINDDDVSNTTIAITVAASS